MSDVQVVAQHTPNPNSMKFNVNRTVLASGSVTWTRAEEADAPWAKEIFGLAGVVSIFCLNDFVTVSKSPDSDWADIVDGVQEALRKGLA